MPVPLHIPEFEFSSHCANYLTWRETPWLKGNGKHYSLDEKVSILKRHLLEKVPVSDLCDQHGLHPTVFHRWMKEFFEKAALAFEKPRDSGTQKRKENKGAVKPEQIVEEPLQR
jgi:transposase-like protein